MHPRTPYAFRVLGSPTARRRLTDARAALSAYASCDERAELHREAYLSYYWFPPAFREHLERTGSTRDYCGACWAPFMWLDLDSPGDPEGALGDARRLAGAILDRYRTLDEEQLLAFLSGGKGYHVALPSSLWLPEPSAHFHRTTRRLAEHLAGLAGVTIDAGTFDKVRLFRAPNSRHPRSGLFKRRLSVDELMHLSPARIHQLAEAPAPFDLPEPAGTDPRALADWQAAEAAVQRDTAARAGRAADLATGSPRLNRQTLDFIRDGATAGDRHRLLFSAAANLAEFGCPPGLAHALLSESALDSGLRAREILV